MDVVALASVITTGICSPLIGASIVGIQAKLKRREYATADARRLLDTTAEYLAKMSHMTGHVVVLWQRGISPESEEPMEDLRRRREAQEGIVASREKLAVRFGASNKIVSKLDDVIVAMDRLNSLLSRYRDNAEFEPLSREIYSARDDFGTARNNFAEEAYSLQRNIA